jgi:polysaccharide biosynthesis transport protein
VSTSRNPEASATQSIPTPSPEEHRGGELVPAGNYPLAPFNGQAWQAGPSVRPDMLSAAPDPLSLLRAYKRRWPLAAGIGILAGLAAMAAAWTMIPQKGEVYAYIQVLRNPETMMRDVRVPDGNEFITIRNTAIEMMKSKMLLTRALRDPAIAQLPVVRKQQDPVDWLKDELQLKYPNDAELLQITMSGEDVDQVVKIVKAVLDAYFKEVVEKGVTDRAKKEQTLKKLFQERNDALIAEMKDVENLQKALGIIDPAAAAQHNQILQQQLGSISNSIFSHTTQISGLEVEIDHFKLEIELAQDPVAKEARAEEEMHKDERLKKLEDQLSNINQSIAAARNQVKGNDNPSVKRAEKDRSVLEDQISTRRDELLKKFSDSNEAIKVKESKGKMESAQRHRDNVLKHLEELKDEQKAIQEKLSVITRDTAELETKKQKVHTLQLVVEEINRDLHKISLERQAPNRIQRLDDPVAPSSSPMKRKVMMVCFCGLSMFMLVGLAVSFYECQARRIVSSTQLIDGLGMRVVGALPSVSRPGRKALAAANGDMNRLLVESIDTVRTNLIHSTASEPVHVVMITSALDREGKTTVASQLAASLARCGRRTLLVDGDLRRPTAHRLFELPLEPGVCEVLRGEAETDDVIRPTRVAGLWMISAGQYDLESIQALSKERLGDMIDLLRSRFDFVVVDSAPVLSIADSSMLGQHVDAAILCVMREVSQAAKVYEASEQLRAVGVHVLGTVINGERTEATYRAYSAKT